MIERLWNFGLSAWAAGSAKRFRHAARDAESAQRTRLKAILEACEGSIRGDELQLSAGWDYDRFRDLPVTVYEDYQPYVERIMRGEANVLTGEPVRVLEPTSGSSSASKLIPYTAGLQREFQEAANAWIWSLYHEYPSLSKGKQYWSVSPNTSARFPESAVPVGFDDDASYLGTVGGLFAKAVWAVPPAVAGIADHEQFQLETLCGLLGTRDLRLISVWHPSFLTILLDAIPDRWDDILKGIRDGSDLRKPNPRRAADLAALDGSAPPSVFWPDLTVVSCWGGKTNAGWLRTIRENFPKATIQEKGLVATEGITTIPFEGSQVLCIHSHFFEFRDEETGVIHPSWDLAEGKRYSLVLSTSGGLLRYDTHDLVRVTGFMETAPTLAFEGRDNVVSDMVGEKLTLEFVQTVLDELYPGAGFKTLMPRDGTPPGYVLVLHHEGSVDAQALDERLCDNYHYAHARNLGQLAPVEILHATEDPSNRFREVLAEKTGASLGDVKIGSLMLRHDLIGAFMSRSGQE